MPQHRVAGTPATPRSHRNKTLRQAGPLAVFMPPSWCNRPYQDGQNRQNRKTTQMPNPFFQSAALAVLLGFGAPGAFAQNLAPTATPQTLQDTLRQAQTGGRIALAQGDYGTLSLRGLSAPKGTPLVIGSADPARPARFAGLMLQDVSNLVLEDVVFDYTFQPDDPPHLRPFAVADSQGITIRRAIFDGDLAWGRDVASDGFGTGYGLSIVGSANVTLQDSQIYGFLRGLVVNGSKGITIQGNDLHDLRSDGMDFAQVTDVAILRNHIHDFAASDASTDHADMIQFWTNGTTQPTRNVIIRDNVLNAGAGRYTQSIFMRNDLVDRELAGPEMFYRDIQIAGNVIINAHRHGITVGETDGLSILNNTVVRNAAAAGKPTNRLVWIPLINVAAAARRVTIADNVTGGITGAAGQANWTVTGNLLVQDAARMKPGFYGHIFVKDILRDQTRLTAFAPLTGGPLDGTGIGSSLLNTAN